MSYTRLHLDYDETNDGIDMGRVPTKGALRYVLVLLATHFGLLKPLQSTSGDVVQLNHSRTLSVQKILLHLRWSPIVLRNEVRLNLYCKLWRRI